jgi:hypothetical protein
LVEERLLTGLDDAGQDQRYVNGGRGCDCAVRPLLRGHPPDPEQVVALALVQRPRPQVDWVGDRADRGEPRRCRYQLGAADAHERGLVAVARIERRGLRGERSVQRVHERGVDAVRHREPREPAVVVNDIKAIATGGDVDLVERSPDVVDLV